MGVNKYNSEGYLDLTAYEAIQTVDKEIRDGQRRRYPKIYICSPFRGDTEVNTQNAISYCRFAVKQGYFPIAPHIWADPLSGRRRPRRARPWDILWPSASFRLPGGVGVRQPDFRGDEKGNS